MESINVPIRVQNIYQTDDGMRIESWKKIDNITKDKPAEFSEFEHDNKTEVFVGVMNAMTPMGPREFKFEIPAENLKEAFSKYVQSGKSAMEALQKEMRQKQSEQIEIASPDALEAIDKMREKSGLIIP